jgi:hypothetical protein
VRYVFAPPGREWNGPVKALYKDRDLFIKGDIPFGDDSTVILRVSFDFTSKSAVWT